MEALPSFPDNCPTCDTALRPVKLPKGDSALTSQRIEEGDEVLSKADRNHRMDSKFIIEGHAVTQNNGKLLTGNQRGQCIEIELL